VNNTGTKKRWYYEINGILKRKKNGVRAACLKNSVRIFVEKTYKMVCLEGSGVPVMNIRRTVPKDKFHCFGTLSVPSSQASWYAV
jgi:hypothetical protein